MIVVMNPKVTEKEIKDVVAKLEEYDLGVHVSKGKSRTIIGAIGDRKKDAATALAAMEAVEKVVPVSQPFKLVSRDFQADDSVFDINGVKIGGEKLVIMAGPCAVESREQLLQVAGQVASTGVQVLRGGAYKPRTSPYSFQGMAEKGLQYLAEAREKTGLLIVTEITSQHNIEIIGKYADIFQVGARNMQNFDLLKELGKQKKPILLKRGLSATVEEWLMSAEYIMSEGNRQVILCERGIRTFETYTRNTLDLSCIPVVKSLSHLPVIVDPSHGTGNWRYVPAMSKAAIAAGADGLMLEVHPNPAEALCDGAQSLTPGQFNDLIKEVGQIAGVIGRTV